MWKVLTSAYSRVKLNAFSIRFFLKHSSSFLHLMYLYYSLEKSAVWQNRDLLDFSFWRFCWVASSLTQREFRAAVLMLLVHSVRHYLAESLPFQMPWMLLCEHQAIPRHSRMWRHLSCVFLSEINFWYQIFIYKESFKLFTEFRQNGFLHEDSNYLNKCVGPFWKENPLVIGRIMKRDSEVQPDITRDGSRRNGKNHTKSFVYPEKLNQDRVVHLQRGCLLFCGGLWGRWECGQGGEWEWTGVKKTWPLTTAKMCFVELFYLLSLDLGAVFYSLSTLEWHPQWWQRKPLHLYFCYLELGLIRASFVCLPSCLRNNSIRDCFDFDVFCSNRSPCTTVTFFFPPRP